METKGYYSLVQFSPDLSRREAVNIGVVVYSPGDSRTRVKLLKNNSKIRKFFGKQDWSFILYSKEALQNRLQREQFASRQSLQEFISKRANAIQMTPLETMNLGDIDRDIERLFANLVVQSDVPRRKRIDKAFGDKLLQAGVRGLVEHSVQVRFPYFDEPLRAPFGYQNGRYNLLSPIQFGSDLREVISKVGEKAVEGEVLFKNPDPVHGQLCLNVVAKFSEDLNQNFRSLVETIFREHQVKLYNLDNLDPLLIDIRSAAADHSKP